MWTQTACSKDLPYFLNAIAQIGVPADLGESYRSAMEKGRCLLAGRFQVPEGMLIVEPSFFGRPFISLVFVEESARRSGVGSALMSAAEVMCAGKDLFTSTNVSNHAMQMMLQKRGYVSAGVVLHLDPGDPELIFVKKP
jgi:GNAT superfamily N-acetyltransferase